MQMQKGSEKYSVSEETFKSYKTNCMQAFFCLFTVYAVFFAIFGFANPDPKNCYYFPGLEVPSRNPKTLEALAIENGIVPVKKGYPLNVASLYRVWF